jgi:hypothetical protein
MSILFFEPDALNALKNTDLFSLQSNIQGVWVIRRACLILEIEKLLVIQDVFKSCNGFHFRRVNGWI